MAVSGKITLDGPPLPGGIQTGSVVDANGEYRIEKQKGLPPGKYRVEIHSGENPKAAAPVLPGAGGMPPPAVERVPAKYNTQTMLTAEVLPSTPARFDFDLKTK